MKQLMFIIGDRIRYPHHGIGRITDVKTIDTKVFYNIEMENIKMRILVPIDKMNEIGATFVEAKL